MFIKSNKAKTIFTLLDIKIKPLKSFDLPICIKEMQRTRIENNKTADELKRAIFVTNTTHNRITRDKLIFVRFILYSIKKLFNL